MRPRPERACLRIGVDARPLVVPDTGIGRYTGEILSRLADTRHQLYLYAHRPFDTPLAERSGVTVRHGNLALGQLASVFAQLRYPRWSRRDALDVFWSPRHHLPLGLRVPSVVTVHDLVWRKAPESMIRLGRALERLLMPPSLRKANAIIAVSESTRRDLVEFDPGVSARIQVIPEAPFTRVSATAVTEVCRQILFVGTFEPRKNLPTLLRAYARLRQWGVTSHELVLAGKPGWKVDVRGLIDGLGLGDHVRVLRPADQRALEQVYAECDFYVQPSLYEGFGLPVLEAMSFGKPVIASDTSSLPEVAGDGALLVDPLSVDDLAAAMRRLIEDRDTHALLSKNARLQAGRFSWDRAAAATLKVLESVARAPVS